MDVRTYATVPSCCFHSLGMKGLEGLAVVLSISKEEMAKSASLTSRLWKKLEK